MSHCATAHVLTRNESSDRNRVRWMKKKYDCIRQSQHFQSVGRRQKFLRTQSLMYSRILKDALCSMKLDRQYLAMVLEVSARHGPVKNEAQQKRLAICCE